MEVRITTGGDGVVHVETETGPEEAEVIVHDLMSRARDFSHSNGDAPPSVTESTETDGSEVARLTAEMDRHRDAYNAWHRAKGDEAVRAKNRDGYLAYRAAATARRRLTAAVAA